MADYIIYILIMMMTDAEYKWQWMNVLYMNHGCHDNIHGGYGDDIIKGGSVHMIPFMVEMVRIS